MKTLRVDVGEQEISGPCLKVGQTLWAHINGRTVVYESEKTRSGKRQQLTDDPRTVKAPMPGKIIKVLCQPGDAVRKDQTLVAMEAMKMEYALKSHMDGKVKKVNCSAGGQVSLGQMLVELED